MLGNEGILKFFWFFFLLAIGLIIFRHPLAIRLLLIVYSFVLSIMAGVWVSSWIFYRLILVFLGGVIVLVLYICALRRSEKFFLKEVYLRIVVLVVALVVFKAVFFGIEVGRRYYDLVTFVSGMYKNNFHSSLFFFVVYLLFRLFLIVKFSESFKGALVRFK